DRGATATMSGCELVHRPSGIVSAGETLFFFPGPTRAGAALREPLLSFRHRRVGVSRLGGAHGVEWGSHRVGMLIRAVGAEFFARRRVYAVGKCVQYPERVFLFHGLPLSIVVMGVACTREYAATLRALNRLTQGQIHVHSAASARGKKWS